MILKVGPIKMPQLQFSFRLIGFLAESFRLHPQIFLNKSNTHHDTPLSAGSTFAMGFWDSVTDLLEAAKPWADAEAEAAAEEPKVMPHPKISPAFCADYFVVRRLQIKSSPINANIPTCFSNEFDFLSRFLFIYANC
jgi:hypothetical protein